MSDAAKKINKLYAQIAITEKNIVMRHMDTTGAPDDCAYSNRLRGMITKMESNQNARYARVANIASLEITGKRWSEFAATVKGGYTPSVSGEQTVVNAFADAFQSHFGRDVYIYSTAA